MGSYNGDRTKIDWKVIGLMIGLAVATGVIYHMVNPAFFPELLAGFR